MSPLWFWIALFLGVIVLVIFFYAFASTTGDSPQEDLPVRRCPVCGSRLEAGENILAERLGKKEDGREKILIKGCPRCLRSR